jgi:hypothetical protein
VDFLDRINHGSPQEKAKLSFQYLSRSEEGRVGYEDIAATISELLFVWNFLTGEKISTAQSVEAVCLKLGISEATSVSFPEYLAKYDQQFSWYDFFNAPVRHDHDSLHQGAMRNHHNEFRIDQIEEYLKLVHTQVELLLFQFKGTPPPTQTRSPIPMIVAISLRSSRGVEGQTPSRQGSYSCPATGSLTPVRRSPTSVTSSSPGR